MFNSGHLFAQDRPASPPPPVTNPKVVGYLSFIFPIVTINKDETTPNFKKATTIGFPVGVNVLYSEKFGFSYALSLPARFGNNLPASIGANIQFGFTFN